MASSSGFGEVYDRLRTITEKYKSMKSLHCEWKFTGEWLKFGIQHYSDTSSTERTYEVIQRTTRTHKGGIDGVDAIGIRTSEKGAKTIVLVVIYRAPVGKLMIEFPAGLVDKKEELEEAALRELKEETGENGKIISSSKKMFGDPWKSTETSVIFTMDLLDKEGTTDAKLDPSKLDDDEFLSTLEVPLEGLLATLDTAQEKFDIGVEAKLYTFAIGLNLAKMCL